MSPSFGSPAVRWPSSLFPNPSPEVTDAGYGPHLLTEVQCTARTRELHRQ